MRLSQRRDPGTSVTKRGESEHPAEAKRQSQQGRQNGCDHGRAAIHPPDPWDTTILRLIFWNLNLPPCYQVNSRWERDTHQKAERRKDEGGQTKPDGQRQAKGPGEEVGKQ